MNSQEEKEIFENYGWEYNYVQREWSAPDGYKIGIEDLMKATDEFGPNVEIATRNIAAEHGKA
jgi:hypothetical protein